MYTLRNINNNSLRGIREKRRVGITKGNGNPNKKR